ncbi:EpsD family peptidyl-prolyl cis-trans isomerase [Herbaspirillum sp.]|uniref:EpsD family peptidyl-prolyl cis-trans isomerase n=1 Tax=Herbaspirillum sp. TaxID=1890675 RepID=UPI0025C5CD5B|nr:EpsD family peptidyl-prolyl cis-trans isomerase [Herbaspirillum sp.]
MRKSGMPGAVLLAVAVLALAGCEKAKPSGQSLAQVNGEEITVHQLNAEVKSFPGSPPATLLEALVNRQLLVDAARKAKIDEDPAVLAELQKVRDTVLAQAYVNRRVGPIAPPTEQEIAQFYKDSPDSFAQRRQYEFGEAIIDPKDMSAKIEGFMVGKKSIDEIGSFLDGEHVPYRRESASRFSTELPTTMSESLRTMEPGTVFVVKENDQTLLVSLQSARSAPLSLAESTPQIRQLLTARKYTELVNAQIKPLKEAARIEYLARGEAIMKAAPQQAQPVKPPSQGEVASGDDGHIQRGIASMK